MTVMLFNLQKSTSLSEGVGEHLGCQKGEVDQHYFPDGECLITVKTPCKQQRVIIFHQFQNPTREILPLFFLAKTLKELGATQVGLITPYLPYLRQDAIFAPGQGVTAKYFGGLVSSFVDWLITVDPHLHRIHELSEVYSIPTQVLQAENVLADWIIQHIPNPLIIGPDSESESLANDVAIRCQAPYLVFKKERLGDFTVNVSGPSVKEWQKHTPVIVDDIIATGHTQSKVVSLLASYNMAPVICMGVHGLFCANAKEVLQNKHISKVITSNSLPHPTNQVDLTQLISQAAKHFIAS